MHGEVMSPFDEGITSDLNIINETGMPIIIGEKATNCIVKTNGEVLENEGVNIEISKI